MSLVKHALKAVIGVGKKAEMHEDISPGGILFFALLVGVIFLGTVACLMLIASRLVQ
tara:strand:+ start:93 stop:263 length:171 start_codon:yes stop_codon:yes gene_type:complete